MIIEFPRTTLLQTLKLMHSILDRKNASAPLTMIHVTTSHTGVRLAATDLELGLQRTLPIPLMEERAFLIPDAPIYEFIKELTSDTIRWSIDDDHHITITSGKAKAKFNGMKAEDYPALPPLPDPFIFSLPAKDLSQLLTETLPAVGEADGRYILNAIKLTISNAPSPTLQIVGTDGHRLVITQQNTGTWLTRHHDTRHLLIPKKAGKVLQTLIPDKEPPLIAIGANQSLAGFQIGDYLLTSRLLDGSYPAYDRIIPTLTTARLTVSKTVLEDSIRRVSVIGGKDTKPMELSIADNHLTLHAHNVDVGEATETLETPTSAQPFKAGFNAQYLLDALETMPGEHCQLYMESPQTPCVLTTPDRTTQFKHIIMPLTLTS